MSQENVELVRRFYKLLPDLRDMNPDDDEGFLARIFRDYLDERWELVCLPGIRKASRCSRGEGHGGARGDAAGHVGRMAI